MNKCAEIIEMLHEQKINCSNSFKLKHIKVINDEAYIRVLDAQIDIMETPLVQNTRSKFHLGEK